MSGIFPDAGVAAASATGSTNVPLANLAAGCDALFYNTRRCSAEFDPVWANNIISELINLVLATDPTYEYDCNINNNLAIVLAPAAGTFPPLGALGFLINDGADNWSLIKIQTTSDTAPDLVPGYVDMVGREWYDGSSDALYKRVDPVGTGTIADYIWKLIS